MNQGQRLLFRRTAAHQMLSQVNVNVLGGGVVATVQGLLAGTPEAFLACAAHGEQGAGGPQTFTLMFENDLFGDSELDSDEGDT